MPIGLNAQNTPAADLVLWPLVEQHLDQRPSDTSFQFILPIVRKHCGNDFDCQLRNYFFIIEQLERKRFNLPAAIFVAEEIKKIAHQHNAKEDEAKAFRYIGNYYNALGEPQKALLSMNKALELYQKIGEKFQITKLKLNKITLNLTHQKVNDVLPEMNALLDQAVAAGDTHSTLYMHLVLIDAAFEAEQYDESAEHIDFVEKIPVSNPLRPNEYSMLILVHRGRALLAEHQNNLEKAAYHYQKALRLCEEEPSLWLEIEMLRFLAKLEWKRGNTNLSKSYLNKAQSKAENLKLDDLLTPIFALKAEIAEAEGDFENALRYTKKKYFYTARFSNKNAGFDLRNYNLQLEKDQLSTENRNSELQLQIKNVQLRSVLIGTFLILLLAAFLFIGWRTQRKQKRHLAVQNDLIQQQSEQLKSLDAAKSRFFANVSHELRTPLTLLVGPIHTLLKEKHLTDKQTRLLKIADQSGKQLEQLIAEILDLRKLELGKMELEKQATELSPFFSHYLVQFESLAERKQIDFSYKINVTNGLAANIDRAKCRQMLYNLLSNAFKFTPTHGRISTEVSLQNGRLQLTVADSGTGIHPDDLPHVFDRFFQTSRPDKPVEGGTGIGLNLCQEYAQLFGGTIEASSREGEGSVFRVQFPVTVVDDLPAFRPAPPLEIEEEASTMQRQPPAKDNKTAQVLPGDSRPTILVVEDKDELQEYLRLILSEKYHVVTAGNGQVACVWLAEQRTASNPLPALILSDLMMPVMDGYQLLEKLKSDDATRHIPVVMLTARADVQDKLKALRIGVDDYLLKPFDEEELLVRLENLLKNQTIRLEHISAEPEPAPKTPLLSAADQVWLEAFEAYVQRHLASDILTVSTMAHEFAMSESTLLRQLKRRTGLSPLQYIQEVRLTEARRLLENGSGDSIAQVALKTGYSDPRYFSRIFRQQFGKSPSDILMN